MRTIWKFRLTSSVTRVQMPIDRKILCVQMQNGFPVVWAEVEPSTARIDRTFVCIGTGQPLTDMTMNYVGTVQTPEQIDANTFERHNEVWHVYEVIG